MDNVRYGDELVFGRDCAVTQIPSGNKITIPRETKGMVTQTLGGNVTLQVPAYGALVQVSSLDLDALLKDGKPIGEAKPAAASTDATATEPAKEADIWATLKTCYDPEIPVNIVDLGLVYDVKMTPTPTNMTRVDVKMTLTAMGCGMGPVIAQQAKDKLLTLPGVEEADVQIVWDPPWNQSMITEDGKKRLGIW
jgi:probable FeS assembly SUF system protein SufT